MPRLVMAAGGDSERELCITAPVAPWAALAATPPAAWQNLAETFVELREPVCRYLLALGLPPAEAEEIVQETFLRLCQHLASDGAQPNLRGWIFRVAHKLARDEHRRRRRVRNLTCEVGFFAWRTTWRAMSTGAVDAAPWSRWKTQAEICKLAAILALRRSNR